MDQIQSTDNDEVNDECGLQYDSSVNTAEEDILNNFSNLGDGIASNNSNDENQSSEKPSDSVHETDSLIGENGVSSTSYAENEVASNDSVINQHSTCETMDDFENGKEVEVECSGGQPNVDINADSNFNNPPELPCASDHIELPSAPDHIEVSSASDIELPSPSDHIELPSASNPIERPSASDHIELPSLDHVELPSPSDHIELPSASDQAELPLVDHVDSSSLSDRSSVPTLSCGVANTNAEGSPNTEVVSNGEASDAGVVTDAEVSPNTEVVANAESCSDSEVITNAETSTTGVTNAEATSSTEVVIDDVASSNTEAVTDPDSSHQPNEDADDVSELQNACVSPGNQTNVVNDETPDRRNNFLPTIVAIRGGCTDVLEKTSDASSSNSSHENVSSSTPPEMPSLNIVNVLGGCKDIDPDSEISNTNVESDSSKTSSQIVPADCKETDILTNCPVNEATECGTTSATLESSIKEEKTKDSKVEDPDVICVETTSEIPSPIPIKKESNIESLNVEAESRTSKQNGKFTAKKRLTRLRVSPTAECITLSSSSDADNLSDSKKRSRSSKNAAYSGYTCHLCDTVFQEHELLNEHMILHRNNSLIEAKVQNRTKATKQKPYSCDICQKQLSTSQSLQQHVLIHKNEKPFVCGVCHKDFRHLQNYRIHQQKHKAEQRRHGKAQPKGLKGQLEKSVVRGVDFGRLVGPLFMKESLYHGSSKSLTDASPKTPFRYSSKESLPRLSFDQPPFKSNSTPVIIRRREPSPDSKSDDECVAVKSFSNIESVVMNAAKIIVKLDNLDTSVLKRKLQTPDISIDQAPKKCRVMLSPIALKCNVKLDEIENIPMDVDVAEVDLPAAEQKHEDPEGNEGDSVCPGTLTDNELFDLLNDDTTSANTSSGSRILKPDHSKIDDFNDSSRTTAASPPKRSNVIFVEAPPSYEMSAYEDEDTIDTKVEDAFDTAFQKVAVRRLALLRKRAAENGGKVESRYLLGPLFWHKALRRAQRRAGDAATNVDITFSSSKNGSKAAALRTRISPFGGRSRFDNRRTNDPTKLQVRAERKFKSLLELAKMLSDLNSLNLTGPLFWRRTLQLAGVRRGEDLRMYVNVTSPTLDGIEFVDDGGQLCDFDAANTEKTSPSQPADSVQPSPSDQVPSLSDRVQLPPSQCVQPLEIPTTAVSELDGQQTSGQLATCGIPVISNVAAGDMKKLTDDAQSSIALAEPSSYDAAAENASDEVNSLKTDSILYESLTKPKEKQQPSTTPEGVPPSYVDSTGLFVVNQNTTLEPSVTSKAEVENCTLDQSNLQCPELTGDVAVDEGIAKLASIDSGNIVLNVDGGGLQLIPAGDQVPMGEGGQNFVLVSDGSGTMQYMVNVPNDHFGNFELIGNAAGGDQVAYAIQFDGENYAAVQFVQDGGIQLQDDRALKEAQMLVDPKAAYLVADPGATAAAVTDPSHIGKELSDFLNLDYGNLLKNGNANQTIS